jgi:Ca2+-binding RTX toxin-like protein
MANVQLFAANTSTDSQVFTSEIGQLDTSLISDRRFEIASSNGSFRQIFNGLFEINNKGRVKRGTISSFETLLNGVRAWSIFDLDITVKSYNNLFAVSKQNAFDSLFGANDSFTGSDFSDVLFSYGGDDLVDGGGGNDFLVSGTGEDQLFGGDGDDVLDGDLGADQFTGGLGDDTFATKIGNSPEFSELFRDPQLQQDIRLTASNGVDLITSFSLGQDLITYEGNNGVTSFSPVASAYLETQSAGQPVLYIGDWTGDAQTPGLNRGSFTFNPEGSDALFFVPTEELTGGITFFQDLTTSSFGTQIFVIQSLGSQFNNF